MGIEYGLEFHKLVDASYVLLSFHSSRFSVINFIGVTDSQLDDRISVVIHVVTHG